MQSPTKLGRFLFSVSADASSTFYAPQTGRASLPLPPGEVSRSDGEGAFLSEASSPKRAQRAMKRIFSGTPKSPIDFWGKRKHNGALSFFRISEKTISAVCADEAQRSKFIGAPSRNEFWEPQESVASEGKDERRQPRSFFILRGCLLHILRPSGRGGPLLCPERQSKQNALLCPSRRAAVAVNFSACTLL